VGTPVELLQALVTTPAAETPVEPAWTRYLPLLIADSLAHAVTLEVWVRETQQTLFLGPAAIPGCLRSDDGEAAWGVGVWTGDAMTQWLADAGVPEAERTVGRLLAVLKGEVRGVRTR
jgi:hypothetical protein